jgi:hypothetical protein
VLRLNTQGSFEQTHGIAKLAGLQRRERALIVVIDDVIA